MDSYRMDMDKIRLLAFNKGMSVSKLCEKAGMGRSRATRWKTEKVSPKTVYRVAQVLEVVPEELIMKTISLN